ncbi:hypothetical protein LWI29_022251 [Acer saccharum]|uniref:Disease resistance R13L4/SHOC-2-like LRR domain-containing protein n=1 Tax=Acer saccharum TaxID=4024 RepID=A0AA39RK58_ACESA|nr:hypothetical protein LWI29_022251 [Acer saccharum]
MHDLHNELAQYTAGESCFKYEIGKVISQGARHFSFVKDNFDFTEDFNSLTTAVECLRTFLPLSFSTPASNSTDIIDDEIIEKLLGAQKQLRVLSLYGYNIFKLSCELSKLIHLRSLDFSFNPITTLPDSTGVLYNLEILLLSHCTKLIELPSSLGKLINLDYLDLNETKSLKWMPPEFSKLEKLQTLTTFVVSNNDKGSKITELGSLPLLVKLHIVECSKLEFLVNETAGYPNLELLEIISGCDSLTHFKLKSFNKLKYLFIKDCKNLENIEVPEDANWNLQFIEDLGIFDCPKLNLISEAGLPAPSLKSLVISNCNNLESIPNQMYRLTSLEELSIFCCSKLQSFPNGGLPPNLQSLLIEKCDLLTPQHAWGLNNMLSLTELRIIGGCKNLKLFPEEGLLPASLTSLQICEFPVLETLNLNGLLLNSSLEKMEINTCASLRSMSAGSLPSTLSSLKITGCSLMTERCQVGGEDWSKIRHIQNKVING